ncbi:riboflavin synthase [Oceanobacillus neutriphilus]|uniref:Riboflavin synthase n=1 Tax=Oceanobacillus neutriphilus TaxID=531815 RepID=A0ABQ2NVT2_9BACI|nr:riboflavin synthase [Oceanobacillus neutriphilus]GGP11852.1 riboflavin synthase subunit alpha [Oceanobacillus neutriphilus]
MFTGLIQETGTVKRIQKVSQHIELTCTASRELLQDYKIGDSMAINGVCLTAIEVTDSDFTVDIMPETFQKSIFSDLRVHALVNLERAMSANGRLEGHIVSGHVDTTTRLIKKVKKENSIILTFYYPPQIQGEVVAQGSVAINGTSLTVSAVTPGAFSISLIPYSMNHTNLGQLKQGEFVNIETDILGKYIKAMIGAEKNQILSKYTGE